jgi:hypothetical protein
VSSTICPRLFINLTPFIPLSTPGEGEEFLERGFAPLLPILPLPLLREGGWGDRLLNDLKYIGEIKLKCLGKIGEGLLR